MNILVFANEDHVFVSYEYTKGFAFKNAATWVKCALLPVICAISGRLQDNCARFNRIGCLLPHNSLA